MMIFTHDTTVLSIQAMSGTVLLIDQSNGQKLFLDPDLAEIIADLCMAMLPSTKMYPDPNASVPCSVAFPGAIAEQADGTPVQHTLSVHRDPGFVLDLGICKLGLNPMTAKIFQLLIRQTIDTMEEPEPHRVFDGERDGQAPSRHSVPGACHPSAVGEVGLEDA